MEMGGAVDVKVFPAGQLGGERELTEAVKLGTIQMTMVSGAVANVFKEYQILDIPYLFSSAPVAWKVMDGWFGKELAELSEEDRDARHGLWGSWIPEFH